MFSNSLNSLEGQQNGRNVSVLTYIPTSSALYEAKTTKHKIKASMSLGVGAGCQHRSTDLIGMKFVDYPVLAHVSSPFDHYLNNSCELHCTKRIVSLCQHRQIQWPSYVIGVVLHFLAWPTWLEFVYQKEL